MMHAGFTNDLDSAELFELLLVTKMDAFEFVIEEGDDVEVDDVAIENHIFMETPTIIDLVKDTKMESNKGEQTKDSKEKKDGGDSISKERKDVGDTNSKNLKEVGDIDSKKQK